MTKENGTRKVVLNDRGVFFIIGMILTLTFALGYATCKGVEGNKVTTFTEQEIDRIIGFKQMNNDVTYGAEMYVCKDRNGKLMIGWEEEEESNGWSLFGKK